MTLNGNQYINGNTGFKLHDGSVAHVTVDEVMQNDEVAEAVLYAGIKRLLQSATTNKAEGESPLQAQQKRLKQIREGQMWSRGGGHAMSEEERHRRAVLAAYFATYCNATYNAADDAVRKDRDSAIAQTVSAMIQRKEGKEPGKQRLQNGVAKFWENVVEPEVKPRMTTQAEVPEDI